jgi:predicted neuraminidase
VERQPTVAMEQRHTLFSELTPQSVHCATLTELGAPDRLLAACYAFSYETAPDSRIVASTWNGERWSEARTIVDLPGIAVGNPVLFTGRDGIVHLFFALLYGREWTDARVTHMRSADGGTTWGSMRTLHPMQGLMTKTRPLQLADWLLLPVYDEASWCSHVLVSGGAPTDGSPTDGAPSDWQLYGDTTARRKTIQPAVVELADGTLLMYSRSVKGSIYAARSFNGGFTWTASQPTPLPNPNSGIDLLSLRGGRLLLAYNPTAESREQLALAVSEDEGASWSAPMLLEDGVGEFSYPYVIQASDGRIHLLYTAHRVAITHLVFDEAWVVRRVHT